MPAKRETFEDRVDRHGPISTDPFSRVSTNCWLWGGKKRNGYGYHEHEGRMAHVWAYEQEFGPVPEGLELDHLCRVRSCVRPDHLEPVTHLENMRRSRAARKDRCDQGHLFTPANTYRRPGRLTRACRTCRNDASRRYKRKVRV